MIHCIIIQQNFTKMYNYYHFYDVGDDDGLLNHSKQIFTLAFYQYKRSTNSSKIF